MIFILYFFIESDGIMLISLELLLTYLLFCGKDHLICLRRSHGWWIKMLFSKNERISWSHVGFVETLSFFMMVELLSEGHRDRASSGVAEFWKAWNCACGVFRLESGQLRRQEYGLSLGIHERDFWGCAVVGASSSQSARREKSF
jgi:hypothetical protein